MILFTLLLILAVWLIIIRKLDLGKTSSIATLFLFVLYIYGRLWRISLILNSKFDIIENTFFSTDERIQLQDKENFIEIPGNTVDPDDLSIFKLTTSVKIRKITLLKLQNDGSEDGNNFEQLLQYELSNLEPNTPIYIAMEPSETEPCHFFEFEYIDYSKTSYFISENRRDGSVDKSNYKSKASLKTYLYYLVM